MEFRINKSEFLRGLRFAQSIADRKSTMPMLANVLLRTQGKSQLLVAATDLNVSLTAELKSNNLAEGAFTVAAKSLYEIISSAPGDEVTLRKADNHWAEIRSGKVSYRIVGMADRDFPKVPEHKEASFTELDAGVLREMIERTLFSVCNDETRFHLNGVLFESDRRRSRAHGVHGRPPPVSKVERKLEGAHRSLTSRHHHPQEGRAPSCKKPARERRQGQQAGRQDAATSSSAPSPRAATSRPLDTMILAVKLIDVAVPALRAGHPQGAHPRPSSSTGSPAPRAALKRAQLMSSETRGVKFSVSEDSVLIITSDNPDVGEAREELEAQYKRRRGLDRLQPQVRRSTCSRR